MTGGYDTPWAERMWALLPTIYRLRDAEQGGPLRALVELLAREADIVGRDIAALHDDMFVETAQPWVLPYLAELLGVPAQAALAAGTGVGNRAFIANTLRYRRRKGTVPVVEQLARDVTGWRARAVETFPRLIQDAHLEHRRLDHPATADLRAADLHELVDGPFDGTPRLLDVRSIAKGRGLMGIPNLAAWLWRLEAYRLARAEPAAGGVPHGFSLMHPGIAGALANPGRSEADITHTATEEDVPGALRRLPLWRELDDRAHGRDPETSWFDPAAQPFRVLVAPVAGAPLAPLPIEDLRICDLGVWPPAPVAADPLVIAVDPVLGRLAVVGGPVPARLRVDLAYRFAGDLGAGPYDRRDRAILPATIDWQVGVSKLDKPLGTERIFGSLADAFAAWRDEGQGRSGVIVVMDNELFAGDLTAALPPASALLVIAGGWPSRPVRGGLVGERERPTGSVDPTAMRPCVLGTITVADVGGAGRRQLTLDGLVVTGKVTVQSAELEAFGLRHMTIVPAGGGLDIEAAAANTVLSAVRTIAGPVAIGPASGPHRFEDCILDGTAGPAAALDLERCTIFGATTVESLSATGCIFTGAVVAARRQVGCLRFSWVPRGSTTPRRYRCQPDLALAEVAPGEESSAVAKVAPVFVATAFGDPSYGRLAATAPDAILRGGEGEAEMGAYAFVEAPRRLANLQAALEDYLRFGREAGLLDAV